MLKFLRYVFFSCAVVMVLPRDASACETLWRNKAALPVLTQELKDRGIVGQWVAGTAGDVPVALVNTESVEKFKDIFQNSIGFIYQMQPKHNSDHGLIRVREAVMDSDQPLARTFGEINSTGLSAFEVYENVRRKIYVEETRVELVVFLSPEDLDIADFYHRVRRGAVIRVRSYFAKGDINYGALNNVVPAVQEQCFNFSYAETLPSIVNATEAALSRGRVPNLYPQSTDPRLLAWYDKVRKYILRLKIDLNNPAETAGYLNPNLLLQKDPQGRSFLDDLDEVFPPNLDANTRLSLANWYLGYRASSDYEALLKKIGLSRFSVGNVLNGSGDMVLIEDPSDQAAARFRAGNYSTRGAGFVWTPRGQRSW